MGPAQPNGLLSGGSRKESVEEPAGKSVAIGIEEPPSRSLRHGTRQATRSTIANLATIPLVIATGAGAVSRQSLGTAVCGGMLCGTIFGVLLIPVFYVVIQRLSEKMSGKGKE